MRRMLLLACAGLCVLAAGCGGSASTDTAGNATVSVSTTGASSALKEVATQAQAVVTTKIQQLATSTPRGGARRARAVSPPKTQQPAPSTSSDDVAAQLGDTQTQLEDLAARAANVQTDNENLAAARDQLHDALQALADQVGDAKTSVENGDLQQAV